MPTCGKCVEPCNCVFSEDGLFSGSSNIGRHFSTVTGSGSIEDPFKIHFLDQKEFYPRTAEFQFNDLNPTGGILNPYELGPTSLGSTTDPGILLRLTFDGMFKYQSPEQFLVTQLAFEAPDETGYPYSARGSHFLIGATITFDQTVDSGANYKQIIITDYQIGKFEDDVGKEVVVAAQIIPGGGGDPMTISAAGMTPITYYVPGGASEIHHLFKIYVNQSSGSSVVISNMRFWMTQI